LFLQENALVISGKTKIYYKTLDDSWTFAVSRVDNDGKIDIGLEPPNKVEAVELTQLSTEYEDQILCCAYKWDKVSNFDRAMYQVVGGVAHMRVFDQDIVLGKVDQSRFFSQFYYH